MPPTENTAGTGSTVVVAIDGPAGAGKSTVARRVAQSLGFTLLDTGALYRAVALAVSRRNVGWADADAVVTIAESMVRRDALQIRRTPDSGMRILLDGVDVSEEIRAPSISMGASAVSAIPGVRAALLDAQRRFAREGDADGVVCEGRDIGTVVFPEAEVKIFLTASVEERSRRRHRELAAKGASDTFESTRSGVLARDDQDERRSIAPLRCADDAHVVDTSDQDLEAAVARVIDIVRPALDKRRVPGRGGGL